MRTKALVLALLFFLGFYQNAFAALTLDGSYTSTTLTAILTTSNANNIIVAVGTGATSSTQVTGVSDTAGLTWVHRTHQSDTGSNLSIDEWYAISTGTLSSDTITFTYSGSSGRTWAFGVNGANLTTPYDPNVSMPSYAATGSTSATSLANSSLTTTCAKTFVFDILRTQGSSLGTVTVPSGFSQLITSGGSAYSAYEVFSGTLSSATATYNWTTSQTAEALLDAIQDVTCTGSSSSPALYFGGFP